MTTSSRANTPPISDTAHRQSMSKRLGSYFLTSIAGKKALCMKSELHMSQDGPKLPVAKLWTQIITETESS